MNDPELFRHLEFAVGDSTIPASTKFRSVTGKELFQFSNETSHWFRVNVKNSGTENHLWFLEFLDPHIEKAHLYVISGADTILLTSTGSLSFFSTRQVNHKNYLFPFILGKGEEKTLLFCFTNRYNSSLNVAIRPAVQFIDYALEEYYLLGLFYGVLLIMGLYNLFIYFSTKERLYLFYVAYVICYCLNSFQEDGLGFQYIWPYYPPLNHWVNLLSTPLLIISFILYSREFLSVRRYSKILDKTILVITFVYCLTYFVNTYTAFVLLRYFYLVPFALILLSGLLTWRRGNRSAKYFILAFSSLLLFFTVVVLRITNLVPTTVYTVYALNFGFLVEVVLFSYAMGQRLKIEKEEKAFIDHQLIEQLRENEKLKDTLNRNLELKVQERTNELKSALSELQVKNQQIEELNKLLVLDNKTLNEEVKQITKARLMLKDLTLEEFKKIYPDESSCLRYLAEIKWQKQFRCKKCKADSFSPGKTAFSRRCTKCGYDESVTSNTLFHNSKIPITSTFYLVYLVLAKPEISSNELSEKLDLRQKTCWSFKKKIQEAIERTGSPKLNSKEWGNIFYQ